MGTHRCSASKSSINKINKGGSQEMAACYGSYCNGKNFNNNISGDLVPNNLVPNTSEMWKKEHKMLLLKNFSIGLPSQPFLDCHFGFYICFKTAFFGLKTFLQLGCFGLDYYNNKQVNKFCIIIFFALSSPAKRFLHTHI